MARYLGVTLDQQTGKVHLIWQDDDKTDAVLTAELPFEEWPIDEDQENEVFAAAEGIEDIDEAGKVMQEYIDKNFPRPEHLVSTVLDTQTGKVVYIETATNAQWPEGNNLG